MELHIFAFTRKGTVLQQKIRWALEHSGHNCQCFAVERFAPENVTPVSSFSQIVAESFAAAQGLIFIGACGIAVRFIAPYVRDKRRDPAVVCVDEQGEFVISLLSGHLGGANRLAEDLAEKIGAQPVISTATDKNGCFAVDCWAKENNLYFEDKEAAKKISAALLEGEEVFLQNDCPAQTFSPCALKSGDCGRIGAVISYSGEERPFAVTLPLIPRRITIGIGCKKGTPRADIEWAVLQALGRGHLSIHAVERVATIDRKAQEPGLLEFCRAYHLPLDIWTAQQLQEAPGEFSASQFVQQITGVDNVCERAAVLSSGGGAILIPKSAASGVTVAAAERRNSGMQMKAPPAKSCKILLFGGTSEGRELAQKLSSWARLTVSVATQYGRELLPQDGTLRIISGRKNREEIAEMLQKEKFDCVVDATHPYAVSASENIRAACETAGTDYFRLLRPQTEQNDSCVFVESIQQAAVFLQNTQGNILLTTGSKEIAAFSQIENGSERLYARVLPSRESLEKCAGAGIKPSHLLAMQGPFSVEMNLAVFQQWNIAWLVTKQSGSAGGLPEKLHAAQKAGVKVVLVGCPAQEHGYCEQELAELLENRYHKGKKILGDGVR